MIVSILSIVLAVTCLASAVADFALVPRVVETVGRLGLPTRLVPILGVAKAAGGLGLLVGFAVDDLRIFTALCLAVYFLLATALHLRAHDSVADTAPAAVLFAVAAAIFIGTLG